MINNRTLVAGLDKSANNELAKSLMLKFPGLVQAENEFQKAVETGDKNNWLNLFIEQESHYRQTLIVLWMNATSLEKRGKVVSPEERKRLLDFANEVSFQPYSNRALNDINTRIYFVNVGAKVRYQELADMTLNIIEGGNAPGFSIEDTTNFLWTMPYDVLELYPKM